MWKWLIIVNKAVVPLTDTLKLLFFTSVWSYEVYMNITLKDKK